MRCLGISDKCKAGLNTACFCITSKVFSDSENKNMLQNNLLLEVTSKGLCFSLCTVIN